jgi:hypothetical protein
MDRTFAMMRTPHVRLTSPPEQFHTEPRALRRLAKEFAMPRKRTELWPVIAVSVARLAEALDIDRKEIYAALKAGLLPIYRRGTHRRILIADAVEWIRKTWKRE